MREFLVTLVLAVALCLGMLYVTARGAAAIDPQPTPTTLGTPLPTPPRLGTPLPTPPQPGPTPQP